MSTKIRLTGDFDLENTVMRLAAESKPIKPSSDNQVLQFAEYPA